MILPGLIWLWLLAKIRTDGDMPTVIAVVLLAAACVGGELWQMLDSEKEFRGKYTTVTE